MKSTISNHMLDALSAGEIAAIEEGKPSAFIKRHCERVGVPLAFAPISSIRIFYTRLRKDFGYKDKED